MTATSAEATASPASGRRMLGLPLPKFVLAVLVGVLALAIGFGGGVYLAVPKFPANDSADAGFARDMSTHHGQAVSMAVQEYRATSDADLRQIAVDITLTQQAQTGIMQTWLKTWHLPASSTAEPMAWMGGSELTPDGRMPGMASDAELAKLHGASGKAKDILFCQLMIRHHLGGIHMVDGALAKAKQPAVRELAQQMKDGQQYEIDALQAKLKELGATP